MSASPYERKHIRSRLLRSKLSGYAREAAFIIDFIGIGSFSRAENGKKYVQCRPEDYACLTDAPMIREYYPENPNSPEVWADMNYMRRNFVEALADGDEVLWTKG